MKNNLTWVSWHKGMKNALFMSPNLKKKTIFKRIRIFYCLKEWVNVVKYICFVLKRNFINANGNTFFFCQRKKHEYYMPIMVINVYVVKYIWHERFIFECVYLKIHDLFLNYLRIFASEKLLLLWIILPWWRNVISF